MTFGSFYWKLGFTTHAHPVFCSGHVLGVTANVYSNVFQRRIQKYYIYMDLGGIIGSSRIISKGPILNYKKKVWKRNFVFADI